MSDDFFSELDQEAESGEKVRVLLDDDVYQLRLARCSPTKKGDKQILEFEVITAKGPGKKFRGEMHTEYLPLNEKEGNMKTRVRVAYALGIISRETANIIGKKCREEDEFFDHDKYDWDAGVGKHLVAIIEQEPPNEYHEDTRSKVKWLQYYHPEDPKVAKLKIELDRDAMGSAEDVFAAPAEAKKEESKPALGW